MNIPAAGLVALFAVLADPGRTATLTGVVFSDQAGEGAHAVGVVRLSVRGKVYDLEYGEPVSRNFQSGLCGEIGAIWEVVYQTSREGGREIVRVGCNGAVAENVHSPWRLVWDYLKEATKAEIVSLGFFTRHWLNSLEWRAYEKKLGETNVYNGDLFSRGGRCLEVVQVDAPGRTRLRSLCNEDTLGLTVVRNAKTALWEIDQIRIETHQ